ncbi:MAG: sodium ion-translocating decarboxylase subunit beta [Acetobacter sp.]|nr:sodium ion-translocating decarboxylase subunit beta [Bacteroides sp.]MCM1341774.1 sodium ion-translocating decarboxylase subunit beta [Acetobacter sp.]MCM1433117.1 sodium ion-translocating decarboxylase subunit beta [Clostridiales bacterium]
MEILQGLWEVIVSIFSNSGYAHFFTADGGYKNLIMIVVALFFLWLGIKKGFEPLLMIPIAFGMLLANIPDANLAVQYHDLDGFRDLIAGRGEFVGCTPGLMDFLYFGVKAGIYPPLIFLGIGSMTDFSPLIANPKSFILGAAAQFGIFFTYVGAIALGFAPNEAGSIAIIGGADGPTAIFVTSMLAPGLLGTIAVAAYSYMALVPVIQPPIMRVLTTKKERSVVMGNLRPVSKMEKILFPIAVTIVVSLLLPDAASLVGMLMLGNLLKESGRTERIAKAAQNELMNIITIMLGVSVGATTSADSFLNLNTLKIVLLGLIAFCLGTACGVMFGKLMYIFTKGKINPLIGAAGVSAVPMAARVAQKEGQKENPSNFLLMHAMGPNVSGVIGSAVAAGILLTLLR